MTDAATAGIAELLQRHLGLAAPTLGRGALERGVQRRMAQQGISDPAEYHQALASSPAELQALVEALVVRETWFFRHPAAFAALAEWVRAVWLPHHATEPLRVLSLPCSTGEEPYSVVMCLLDAGLPRERCVVHAVDVSVLALERAAEGVYGASSFRGRELSFRDRYFEPMRRGFRLHDAIRRQVSFRQGNLLDPGAPVDPSYAVVFCRNMLIYFAPSAQERAMSRLTQLVGPRGLLFVGPAETHLPRARGWRSLEQAMTFGFEKESAALSPTAAAPRRRTTGPSPRSVASGTPPARTRERLPSAAPAGAALGAANGPPAPDRSLATLEAAEVLADQGRLAEAAAACAAHLAAHGPSAAVYQLLGLVAEVQGRTSDAGTYFRKALYLDPEHGEALVHLALLAERRGDMAEAARLEARARRARRRDAGNDP